MVLPTPVFLPGEFHGQRSLVGYNPWGYKESNMTERLTHIHMNQQGDPLGHQGSPRHHLLSTFLCVSPGLPFFVLWIQTELNMDIHKNLKISLLLLPSSC